MDYNERDESEIIYDILLGLALAVIEDERVDSDGTLRTITNTKLEKFVYMAVEEFELPITYSWYLAGAKAQSPTIRRERFKTAHGAITGKSQPDEPVVRKHLRNYDAPEEVRQFADFFDQKLHWMFKDKYEFLEGFYREYSPDRFRELYLHSHSLRMLLDQTVDQLDDAQAGGVQTGLSSFTGSDQAGAPDHYEYAGQIISNIHLELASDELLQQMLPAYQDFTDILENAYMMLGKMEINEVTAKHLECFAELSDFHFNQAWQYPCLRISIETATGPRREEIITDRSQRLPEFEDRYYPRLNSKQELCEKAGLVPGPEDYPANEGSNMENDIAELTDEYMSRDHQ